MRDPCSKIFPSRYSREGGGGIDLSKVLLKDIDPTCMVTDQHCPFCSCDGHKGLMFIVNQEKVDEENQRLRAERERMQEI
jgi:hypothetical protein